MNILLVVFNMIIVGHINFPLIQKLIQLPCYAPQNNQLRHVTAFCSDSPHRRSSLFSGLNYITVNFMFGLVNTSCKITENLVIKNKRNSEKFLLV
jgi:hypothetical protein